MSQQVKGRLFMLIALIAFSSCALIPTYYKFTEGSREALPAAFNNFFKNTLSLGLDLQGGIHIQYAVDTKEALRHTGRNFAARLMSSGRRNPSSREALPHAISSAHASVRRAPH